MTASVSKGLVVTLLMVLLTVSVSRADIVEDSENALATFLNKYWDSSASYLYQNYPSDGTLSEYWNFAECFEVLLNGVILTAQTGNDALQDKLWPYVSAFYAGQAHIGWNRDYYDDMNWMTMALMKAYYLAQGPSVSPQTVSTLMGVDLSLVRPPPEILASSGDYLNTAKQLYAQIMAAWDTTCCGNLCGGIWWDTAHSQKATASNAGPVVSGVYLYLATGNQTYLTFAEQVYHFWTTNMINGNSQVADHFDAQGNVVWWKYTYNEGLVMAASAALYHLQSSNSSVYQQTGENVANFMVASETVGTSYGPVLNDGDDSSCTGTDCPQFKQSGFTGLYHVQQMSPSSAYQSVLQASVNGIWNNAQVTSVGLFGTGWQGPAPASGTTLNNAQQSAAISALLLCARPPSCV